MSVDIKFHYNQLTWRDIAEGLAYGSAVVWLLWPSVAKIRSRAATAQLLTSQSPTATLKDSIQLSRTESDVEPKNSYRAKSDRDNAPAAAYPYLGQWITAQQCIRIRDFDLPGGLIYVGSEMPGVDGGEQDACLIDPRLYVRIADSSSKDRSMDKWPSYTNISPLCRGAYLKWLADGRRQSSADIGYVFLFFYGLERRLLTEGSPSNLSNDELETILREVSQLLEVYGPRSTSFSGYAQRFLAIGWARHLSEKQPPDFLECSDENAVDALKMALARCASLATPLTATLALCWTRQRCEFDTLTQKLCGTRALQELFRHRYRERYGDGLIIKAGKSRLKLLYRPASPSLGRELQFDFPDLPNPFGMPTPPRKITGLVDECIQEIHRYRRIVAGDKSAITLEFVANLPNTLLERIPTAANLKERVQALCRLGPTIVTIESLYSAFDIARPDNIALNESVIVKTILAQLDFGIAPDPRLHPIKFTSSNCIAIHMGAPAHCTEISREFHLLCVLVSLRTGLNLGDRSSAAAAAIFLVEILEANAVINAFERESLKAYLLWLENDTIDLTRLKPLIAGFSEIERTRIGAVLVSLAALSGSVSARVLRELQKLYGILGIDRTSVIDGIHGVPAKPILPRRISADGVQVRGDSFQLDEQLIQLRQNETDLVKVVLDDVFSDASVIDDTHHSLQVNVLATPHLTSNHAHHQLFIELATKPQWTRDEMSSLCNELQVMLDGSIEALNEWSYRTVDAPLIEEDEDFYIDLEIAKELKNVTR